jgi:hypothetical protein
LAFFFKLLGKYSGASDPALLYPLWQEGVSGATRKIPNGKEASEREQDGR